jgi:hypothetical protein
MLFGMHFILSHAFWHGYFSYFLSSSFLAQAILFFLAHEIFERGKHDK